MGDVLRNRNFLFLWLSRLTSRLGDGIHEIALAWLVLQLTDSALDTGITMMASALPHVLFGLFAGVLIDKFNRKTLLILADLWRCLVVLTIPALFGLNLLEPWIIYMIAFLTSLGEVIAAPTRKAVIPNIVGVDRLDAANSLDQITNSVSALFGLGLGGGVVALLGAANSLYLDAISFALSAALISFLSLQSAVPIIHKTTFANTLAELREGIRYVAQRKLLVRLIGINLAVNFFGTPLFLLIPYYINQVLKMSSGIYGVMMASIMVGMLIGSIYVGTHKLPRGKAIAFGMFGTGGGAFLFALAYAVPSIFAKNIGLEIIVIQLICLVGLGISMAIVNVYLSSFLQSVVPDEKRGRVMSITQAGSMAAMPLAYGLTGFLIETVGFLFVLCGVGVGVLCCTLLTRDIQKIEETGSVD
jgi:MFS family permease